MGRYIFPRPGDKDQAGDFCQTQITHSFGSRERLETKGHNCALGAIWVHVPCPSVNISITPYSVKCLVWAGKLCGHLMGLLQSEPVIVILNGQRLLNVSVMGLEPWLSG